METSKLYINCREFKTASRFAIVDFLVKANIVVNQWQVQTCPGRTFAFIGVPHEEGERTLQILNSLPFRGATILAKRFVRYNGPKPKLTALGPHMVETR
jgi:hypothetical protein